MPIFVFCLILGFKALIFFYSLFLVTFINEVFYSHNFSRYKVNSNIWLKNLKHYNYLSQDLLAIFFNKRVFFKQNFKEY